MGKIKKVFSGFIGGIFALIITIAFLWFQFGGIWHAFKGHSTKAGIIAIIVPPVAWYYSVEFFFHKAQPAGLPSQADQSLADLTPDEMSQFSLFTASMDKRLLSDSEIQAYLALETRYEKRTGNKYDPKAAIEAFQSTLITNDYQAELLRCMLMSLDAHHREQSAKLMDLKDKAIDAGRRASLVKADMEMLDNLASGDTAGRDQYGVQRRLPTRDQILEYLEEATNERSNLQRLILRMQAQSN
jgi:hypothetical protein